jgi:hypothetical protein
MERVSLTREQVRTARRRGWAAGIGVGVRDLCGALRRAAADADGRGSPAAAVLVRGDVRHRRRDHRVALLRALARGAALRAQRLARREKSVARHPAWERAMRRHSLLTIGACTLWFVVAGVALWWVWHGWVGPRPPIERLAVASVAILLAAWPVLVMARRMTALAAAGPHRRADTQG